MRSWAGGYSVSRLPEPDDPIDMDLPKEPEGRLVICVRCHYIPCTCPDGPTDGPLASSFAERVAHTFADYQNEANAAWEAPASEPDWSPPDPHQTVSYLSPADQLKIIDAYREYLISVIAGEGRARHGAAAN